MDSIPRDVGTPEYASHAARSQPVQVGMGNGHLAGIDVADFAKMPPANHVGKIIMPVFRSQSLTQYHR